MSSVQARLKNLESRITKQETLDRKVAAIREPLAHMSSKESADTGRRVGFMFADLLHAPEWGVEIQRQDKDQEAVEAI